MGGVVPWGRMLARVQVAIIIASVIALMLGGAAIGVSSGRHAQEAARLQDLAASAVTFIAQAAKSSSSVKASLSAGKTWSVTDSVYGKVTMTEQYTSNVLTIGATAAGITKTASVNV